jgi:hypothetical protein
MAKFSQGLEQVLKRLGPKKAKEMDEAAKKGMFGQPEKAAKKEKGGKLTEKEKEELQASLRQAEKRSSKKEALTPAEEAAQDRLVQRRIRESGAERAEGMSKADKPRKLTKKEQEREQEALRMKKGGMVKKYAKGGMVKCGASNPASGGSRNK